MFKEVDSKMNLPDLEKSILEFWNENQTFEKSLENRKEAPLYSFYDGPPFATGTPHYGHLIASTIKDVVPRYWTMRGFRVDRIWGWDCHGLPIENIAEKELGITHKKEIESIGVDKFNQVCRSKVLEYAAEWKKTITRLGRWVDMENAYKTMDPYYMESVWWVFKQLWDKGLIYEDYRSMHICPRCETTLSQSEVAEGYKMVKDLSVIAEFKLVDEPGTFVLAWTTTPWTLIGNAALAVGKEIEYVKVKTSDQTYILAEDRVSAVFKDQDYEIIEKMKGSDLTGKRYQPLFDYYSKHEQLENRDNGWKIYSADFVSTQEGTGVVHVAPAFGEDDMNLGKDFDLPFIQHVGMDGIIKPEATDFAGLHVKPIKDSQQTDVEIIKYLANKNLLFSKEKYEHSYPHCWRCETPLLNYATGSWFVRITAIKERALNLAKEINWSPQHIKEGRFGKWLEGARDWSISRQRFWASVIPIWKCQKCGEQIVIGSIKELEERSGQKVSDLHKDKTDPITFSCQKCEGVMKRIPDVLDCWFESGSMPYAQIHYPFENVDKFDQTFPADFIAEGVDQTRTWFYYLHILSTAVKESKAFKNVAVNGIVLAQDGKKMSKRLQNYPDPAVMFDQYGADVMRFYLISSPVVAAENMNFKESEMAELSRGMFRMLWNSYSFFVLYANLEKWEFTSTVIPVSSTVIPAKAGISGNILDRWILSELHTLVKEVNESMNKYDLLRTTRLFAPFIDNLSNWYIRRSRKRFWKSEDENDKNKAFHTLYEVLITLTKLMAPFTPFLSDEIYRNLTGAESVHLQDFPVFDQKLIDQELNQEMIRTRKVVLEGLSKRAGLGLKVRQPLQSITYSGHKLSADLEEIIKDEVNVKEIKFHQSETEKIELDGTVTPELRQEGLAREIIRGIQSLRKQAGFKIDELITVSYQTDSLELKEAFERWKELISVEVFAKTITAKMGRSDGEETLQIENETLRIKVSRYDAD